MSDTSVAGLAFRLIGSLALVVGLLFLLARLANKKLRTPGTGAAVQVVARQSLTRSSGVAVLTIGSRVLVVGTTDSQVSLLAELDPEELLDPAAALAVAEPGGDQGAEEFEELIELDGHQGLEEPEEYDEYSLDAVDDVDDPDDQADQADPSVPAAARPAAVPPVRRRPRPAPAQGPLAGSILSPATWRQTMAALTGAPPPGERKAS